MTIPLKQSTASQEIPLGYFVDSGDGNSEEISLTIANTDIKLWKNGATTLANKNSGGATHISNGIYYAVLDATDTNTLGPLVIFVHVTGALPVRLECCVYSANVYDSMIAGTDYLQTDAMQIEGVDATDQIRDAVVDDATRIDASALNTLSSHDPGSTIAAQSDITGLNDPTAAAIADAVWDELTAGHVTAGSFAEMVGDIPNTAEFAARTLTATAYFDPATDPVATVTNVTNQVTANVTAISGDTTAADNLEAQYDGTGLTGDNYPATQAQVAQI